MEIIEWPMGRCYDAHGRRWDFTFDLDENIPPSFVILEAVNFDRRIRYRTSCKREMEEEIGEKLP